MIKKLTALLIALAMMLGMFSKPTFAAHQELPFDIKPVLPKNQNPNVTSYIAINANSTPLEQELEFIVTNRSSKTQKLEIKVVDAYTSPNGTVQYTNEKPENSNIIDKKYKLTNYLKINEKDVVVFKPKEEKRIKTKLKVDEKLQGVLLGGVSFQLFEEGKKVKQSNSTFQINNKIKMDIGVMITFSDFKEKFDIQIGDPYVDPMPAYFAVRLPVTFNVPLLKKLNLDYEVLYKGKQLFANKRNFDFAPKTKTNIALAWEHDEIKKNEIYVLKGTLSYNLDGKTFKIPFEKEFKYTPDKKYGIDLDVLKTPEVKDSSLWWLLLIAIVILTIVIYYRKKKQDKQKVKQIENVIEPIVKETENIENNK